MSAHTAVPSEAALKWTKEFDPTRLTHHESARYVDDPKKYDYSNLDLYSRMYPSLEEIKKGWWSTGISRISCANTASAMGKTAREILKITLN